MIMFSKQEFSPNIDMLFSFLGFQNLAINAFVFPFGIMSPSLFDVPAILGLPIMGNEIPLLYSEPFEDLNYIVSKEISSYGTFIIKYNQITSTVEKAEHNVFFLSLVL